MCDCNTKNNQAALVPEGYTLVPSTPSDALLASMAMRHRHDYGLKDEEWQAGARLGMCQIHEEVVGAGFYKYPATPPLPTPGLQGGGGALPVALNDDLIFILGRPNFWCAPYATALRALGQEVPTKAEQEQAAVIHWLLSQYLADPANWRDKVGAELERAKSNLNQGKEADRA